MARRHRIQNSFKAGVLSPRAWGRTDSAVRGHGLADGLNMMVNPHGGMRRRNGAEYVADLGTTTAQEHQLVKFRFDGHWMLVFWGSSLAIYDSAGVKSGGTLTTPYSGSDLARLQWDGYQEHLWFAHPDHPVQVLTRDLVGATWSFGDASWLAVPQHAFPDGPTSPPTSPSYQLVFGGTWNSGDTFTLIFAGTESANIVWSSDATTLKSRIAAAGRVVLREPDAYILSDVSVTGTYPTLVIDYIDDFSGYRGFDQGTISGAGTLTPTELIAGSGTQTEDAWSATRGYPGTVAVHNQRLYLGGTVQLPQHLWGSALGSFFDFTTGIGADDTSAGSISVKMVTKGGAAAIQWLASLTFLHVGTDLGDFVIDDSTAPIVDINNHTSIRGGPRQPIVVGSEVLAIDDCRCRISQLTYSDDRKAWLNADIISHFDHEAYDLTKLAWSQYRFPYVWALRDDGRVLCGQYDTELTPWVPCQFGKTVKAIETLEDDGVEYLWLVVYMGGVPPSANLLMRVDLSADRGHGEYLDAWITGSGTTITGLDHLDGETVGVIDVSGPAGSGQILPDQVVAGGQITLAESAVVVAGLRYDSRIKTLAPNYHALDAPVRVVRASPLLLDSGPFTMNGESVRELPNYANLLDTDGLLNGAHRVPDTGYDNGQITIETNDPTPLEITAIPMVLESAGDG